MLKMELASWKQHYSWLPFAGLTGYVFLTDASNYGLDKSCLEGACDDKDIQWRDGTKVRHNASEYKILWQTSAGCSYLQIDADPWKDSFLAGDECKNNRPFACSAPCDDEGKHIESFKTLLRRDSDFESFYLFNRPFFENEVAMFYRIWYDLVPVCCIDLLIINGWRYLLPILVFCPWSNPFSMAGGTSCCRFYESVNDATLDPSCDGGTIGAGHSDVCCPFGEQVPCKGHNCQSHPNSHGEINCSDLLGWTLEATLEIKTPANMISHNWNLHGCYHYWNCMLSTFL